MGSMVAGAAATMAARATEAAPNVSARDPFKYCLNTSTIRGQKLPIDVEVELAARAGYDAIEPWISELDAYAKSGKSLVDLGKKIADAGLKVPSAIGFANFLSDDEGQRKAGLSEAQRCMELVKTIGGTAIAAPPVGVTDQAGFNLRAGADRFAALLALGAQFDIRAQLELWGFSKTLSRLGEVAYVGMESGRGDACYLLDVYHIYKGGSEFNALRYFPGSAMVNFHVNDYPAEPPRSEIRDEHRVYPGDGVAPLNAIYQTLAADGYTGYLSLELFNRTYWEQDAFQVAKTGLEKTKASVAKALNL